MPLIRLDVPASLPADSWRTAADVIYEALHSELGVPENDRFAVVSSHEPAGLQVDPAYLGIARSEDTVIVHVTLSAGRDVSLKRTFYAAVASGLEDHLGIRRAGVIISWSRSRRTTVPSATGAQCAPGSMSARRLRLNAGWRRPVPCR